MNEIIAKLKDIVRVEQTRAKTYDVHIPVLYYGGDWVVVEITLNSDKTFQINDKGCAITNAQAIINDFDNINVNKFLTSVSEDYALNVSKANSLFLSDIKSEQLYSAISEIASASVELSKRIIEKGFEQSKRKIHNLVENKLMDIFKGDYKDKVTKDYELLGQSSKRYCIPFCINDSVKRYIEPVANNTNAIAVSHTKFYDIGKSPEYKREIVIDSFDNWETPNIDLLKPICESITPYNSIAA